MGIKHKMRVLVTRDEDEVLCLWNHNSHLMRTRLNHPNPEYDCGVWKNDLEITRGDYDLALEDTFPELTWKSEPVPMTLMLMEPEEAERVAAIMEKAPGRLDELEEFLEGLAAPEEETK